MRRMKLAVGLAVLAITATAQAHAHPDSHVVEVAGSSAAGSHLFYAVSEGVEYRVDGPLGVVRLGCSEVFLEGELNSGSAVDPFAVVKPVTRINSPDGFDGSARNGCAGPFSVGLGIAQVGDWEIHALGGVTAGDSDQIPVYVSGASGLPLEVHVYALSGGPTGTACNFRVEGYPTGRFSELTQALTIEESMSSGSLTVTSVLGSCVGMVSTGSGIGVYNRFVLGDDDAANSIHSIGSFHPIYLEP